MWRPRMILSVMVTISLIAACATPPTTAPPPEPPDLKASVPPALENPVPVTVPDDLVQLRPEHVDFVKYIPPIPPGNEEPRPLFGARLEDRPWLEKILRGLAQAQPANPEGASAEHRRVSWLEIRLVNGRRILIRDAWDCQPKNGGIGCTTVKGKLVIAEGDGRRTVVSPELETFLHEEMQRAMPPVVRYVVEPTELPAGGQLKVTGNSVAGATAFRLTLERAGTKWPLAEGEVALGAFTWEGLLPADLAPGDYLLNILPDAGGGIGTPLKVGSGGNLTAAAGPAIAWAQVRFGMPSSNPSRALYPGRKADAPILQRLQEWLAQAEPNGKPIAPPGRGPYLTVKYRDGSQVTVFPAGDCVTTQVEGGTQMTCAAAPGEVVIGRLGGSVRATAPDLAAWVSQGWERDAPRVEPVRVVSLPGGGYRVSGDGWAGAEDVTLWVVPDGANWGCCPPNNGTRLAVVPAILGRFAWEGRIDGTGPISLVVMGEGYGSVSVHVER